MSLKNRVLIYNKMNYHYDILESVVTKFPIKFNDATVFYILTKTNKEYEKYIETNTKINILKPDFKCCGNNLWTDCCSGHGTGYLMEYPLHEIESEYDYIINMGVYPQESNKLIKPNDKKYFYVTHRTGTKIDSYENVYSLTPLCNTPRWFVPTVYPYSSEKQLPDLEIGVPTFIVQGKLDTRRRNYGSLIKLLEKTEHLNYKIKIIGSDFGVPPKFSLPHELVDNNKIEIKKKLDFENYHRELLDADVLLPLIDDSFNHPYYTSSYTSSIGYGLGYDLMFVCHKKLGEIYRGVIPPNKIIEYTDCANFIEKIVLFINNFN